jgi:hypothetical protein
VSGCQFSAYVVGVNLVLKDFPGYQWRISIDFADKKKLGRMYFEISNAALH